MKFERRTCKQAVGHPPVQPVLQDAEARPGREREVHLLVEMPEYETVHPALGTHLLREAVQRLLRAMEPIRLMVPAAAARHTFRETESQPGVQRTVEPLKEAAVVRADHPPVAPRRSAQQVAMAQAECHPAQLHEQGLVETVHPEAMVNGLEIDLRSSSERNGYSACGFANAGDINYSLISISSYYNGII